MSGNGDPLPIGWARTTLRDLCEIRSGVGFPKHLQGRTEGNYPFAKVQEISDVHRAGRRLLSDARNYVDDADLAVLGGTPFPAGATVMAKIGEAVKLNRRAMLGRPALVDNNVAAWIPAPGINPQFLYYMSLTIDLAQFSQATAVPSVRKSDLEGIPVSLPPPAEQRRIVEAIETLFAGLNAGADSLRFAQKLTLQCRRAILERALKGDWEEVPLSSVLRSLRNGIFVSRPSVEPVGTAILRISAVRPMRLDVEDVRYAPIDLRRSSDFLLNKGDVLFTRYSGNPEYVGACAVVPDLPRQTLHPDKLIRAVPNEELIDSAFLEMACSAGSALAAIRSRRTSTAGQVGIAGGNLKSVPIPLPSLDDQRAIVREVQLQFSEITGVLGHLDELTRRGDQCRRAVLRDAVAGRLVVQDPSEEPASVLLDRIRAERAATPTSPRKRKSARPA